MKTISIVNLKGGVGKTVTAVNLAAILATEYGARVLLIDADHQGNASKFYRIPAEPGSLADLFEGMAACYTDLIQHTIYRGLDVIPADMSLAALDLDGSLPDDVHGRPPRERALRALTDLRDAVIEDDAYDYIIIDCPPAFSLASISAIAASTDIVIPLKPGGFEIDGMAELTRQVESVRRVSPSVRIAGVLLTMWYNDPDIIGVEDWLRKNSGQRVFNSHIRLSRPVDKSVLGGEPICQWSPTSGAARDYRAWVREYLGGADDGETA
ncbi:ParA family protein [Agathobaculum massiliense]|uniref:ParA family protein n=1 Tax=Agathobaculum massiliense TaxID=3014267 RepID=UPI0036F2F4DE